MCGIAGWAGGFDEPDIAEMIRALRHRGPDETGSWVGDGVGLGVARLAIVDVAHGHQPIFSQDESIVAVCNGEIYNHHTLRDLLLRQGISLASHSDVEVIPHLYQLYGLNFVEHLRGMFAIALWDADRKMLVLARDRAGKKPLWYVSENDRIVFGSEYRAIRAAGWCAPVNFSALDQVMAYGYIPAGEGAIEGLQSVRPGHVVTFKEGRLANHQYWEWETSRSTPDVECWEEHLEETLKEAVRIRIPDERPFGVFLSGGIDSALVTSLATEVHDQPIRTFTVGFDTPAFDESERARRIANHLGTVHTTVVANPDPAAFLPYLARAFDQPFADSSAVPTLIVSALAAKDVTVALSGDGGDEVFAGYRRYVAVPRLQQLNPLLALLPTHSELITNALRKRGFRSVARLLQQLQPAPDIGVRYSKVMQLVPQALRAQIWSPEIWAQVGSAERAFLSKWTAIDEANPIAHMQAMDFRTYLPGDLLVKVDIASMAHSLEVRSPLLDQKVVALAAQIPSKDLVRGRTTKAILRRLLRKRMPIELFDRPKMGFGIPRAEWLRGSWRTPVRDILISPTTRQRGWFDVARIEALLSEHDRGQDRDDAIWALLVIEMWAREWLDASN